MPNSSLFFWDSRSKTKHEVERIELDHIGSDYKAYSVHVKKRNFPIPTTTDNPYFNKLFKAYIAQKKSMKGR
jgi:hypothetical protein